MSKTLAEIFRAHGCDKASHHYHLVYEKLPTPARMLEVGVFRGASLRAWREWWPEAFIHGLDTGKRVAPDPATFDARTFFWMGDSRDVFLPIDFRGRWEYIFDDGSHHPRDQAATFRNLWPLLAPGGRYFIEDVWPWDVMTKIQKLHPWMLKNYAHFNFEAWAGLLEALSGHEVIRHDFRAKSGKPDSYLLEIRKP